MEDAGLACVYMLFLQRSGLDTVVLATGLCVLLHLIYFTVDLQGYCVLLSRMVSGSTWIAGVFLSWCSS